MSVFLGPCGCDPCGPPPPDAKCDYLAFLYGNGRVPIGTTSYFPIAEHQTLTYTVARLPFTNLSDRLAGLGPPPNPPDPSTPDLAYYYDQTGSGAFYQLVGGTWTPSSGPPEYGRGQITASWAVALQECGCPHMIPADSGTLQWGDGDTGDKTITVTPGCPGPPTFWGCNGALGGGEVARVQLGILGSDYCAGVAPGSKAPYGANYTAICVHHWPNGGSDPSWSPHYTTEVGACRAPSADQSISAANAQSGRPVVPFIHSFQRRVSVVKNLAGREVGRIEEDFDETGQWLVQSRARGVSAGTAFSTSRIVADTPEEFEEVNTEPGSGAFGWRRKVTASMPATTPYDKAGAMMADPGQMWDLPAGHGYDTTSGGGWDTVRTINYHGNPPPIASLLSISAQAWSKRSYTGSGGNGPYAIQSQATVNCGGSYTGNPHPSRWEARTTQCALDPATGAITCDPEGSAGEITDTSLTLGPGDVAAAEGYVSLGLRGIAEPPPGCPMPAFVCFPGLPPCP